MTLLAGGLRVLGANTGCRRHGVFTQRPEMLTNDFFVHLSDMGTAWQRSAQGSHVFEGCDRKTGALKWSVKWSVRWTDKSYRSLRQFEPQVPSGSEAGRRCDGHRRGSGGLEASGLAELDGRFIAVGDRTAVKLAR
jgi:hypothetical protein